MPHQLLLERPASPEQTGFGRWSRVTPSSPGYPDTRPLSHPAICWGDQSLRQFKRYDALQGSLQAKHAKRLGRRADSQARASASAAR